MIYVMLVYCEIDEDTIDCCDGQNIDADLSDCSITDNPTICQLQTELIDEMCANANNDCNIHEDCNGNAVSVTGTKGNCDCRCNAGYVGPDCSVPDPQPPPPPSPLPPPRPEQHNYDGRYYLCRNYTDSLREVCGPRWSNTKNPVFSSDCCRAINDGLSNYQDCGDIFRDPTLNSALERTSQYCE